MLPKIKTILYATDMGPGSPHVFRQALSQAQSQQARITILHVVEPLSPFGQSLVELHIAHKQSEQMHTDARGHLKDELEKNLHSFCEKESEVCEEDLIETIKVLEGQPAQTILEQAREIGADLIVMGTHHHTAVGEALLGTTAQKVIHSSDIPTLLVRVPASDQQAGL